MDTMLALEHFGFKVPLPGAYVSTTNERHANGRIIFINSVASALDILFGVLIDTSAPARQDRLQRPLSGITSLNHSLRLLPLVAKGRVTNCPAADSYQAVFPVM